MQMFECLDLCSSGQHIENTLRKTYGLHIFWKHNYKSTTRSASESVFDVFSFVVHLHLQKELDILYNFIQCSFYSKWQENASLFRFLFLWSVRRTYFNKNNLYTSLFWKHNYK